MALMRRWRIERLKGIYLGQHRLSDFTRLNDFLDASNHRIKMAIVSNAELYLVSATRSDHAIAFGHVHGHGLFAQDVPPCFGRGGRLLGVQVHRRGDVHRIDAGLADQVLPARVRPRRAA